MYFEIRIKLFIQGATNGIIFLEGLKAAGEVMEDHTPEIRFHTDLEYILTYVVIGTRYLDKWVFVRHKLRRTWEIPGGHIEEDETPLEAAQRELQEETGARFFELYEICSYSVLKNGAATSGKLFYAKVTELGELHPGSEIGKIALRVGLPARLTYPEIQPWLFKKIVKWERNFERS